MKSLLRIAGILFLLLAAFCLGRLDFARRDDRRVIGLDAKEHAALHSLMIDNLEWLESNLSALADDKPVLRACPGSLSREIFGRLPSEWKQFGGALHYECERMRGLLAQGAAAQDLLPSLAHAVSACVGCHRSFRAEISPTPWLKWNFKRDALVD